MVKYYIGGIKMKKVDIRVVGGTEIDMNTLTPVAWEKANRLTLDYDKVSTEWNENFVNFDMGQEYSWELQERLRMKGKRLEREIVELVSDYTSYKGITWAKVKRGYDKFTDLLSNSPYWYGLNAFWFLYLSYIFYISEYGLLTLVPLLTSFMYFYTARKTYKIRLKGKVVV